jgi:hypothetical protein
MGVDALGEATRESPGSDGASPYLIRVSSVALPYNVNPQTSGEVDSGGQELTHEAFCQSFWHLSVNKGRVSCAATSSGG